MSNVAEAIDGLRSALHKKGVEGRIQDAFDHLATFLVLLNSSSPSVQMIQKLCSVLRQPLLPLYNACLQPTLQLSSSVLSSVLGKLCDTHNVEDERFRSAWDEIAQIILSGILDFLDQKDGNIASDSTVWEALCRIICEFFFFDSGRAFPALSIPLCLSAYNILTEAVTRNNTVRNALHQKAILGGERLGVAISKTRDYLILEALLMLFARLLPPVYNTSQGRLRRVKFVREVLGSPKLFKCSAKLLDIMQNASSTHWDDVAAHIIDALAGSDITCPQPFSINEIAVCGHVFPQPLVTDRLIMDKQAFFANIVAEDNDICESLQVPYSRIRTITLDTSEKNVPKGKVLVMVYLTSPPLVGNSEMKSPDDSLLYAKFSLLSDVMGKFMEALRRRGVGKLNFLNSPAELARKRKNISIGSALRFVDDSSPVALPASFEGKVQHVNQVYKTDIDESRAVPGYHSGDGNLHPASDPESASKDSFLVPEPLESVAIEDVPQVVRNAGAVSPTMGMSKVTSLLLHEDPIRSTRLFGDNDGLSEISDFEPENNLFKEGVATKIPVSRDYKKPTHHEADGSGAASATGIEKSSDPAPGSGGHSKRVDQMSGRLVASDSLPVRPEVVGGVFVPSRNFVKPDGPKQLADNCGPSGGNLVADSEQSGQMGSKSMKDTTIPPKISGNRRKRESIKSSGKTVIEIDDESTPPRKKIRDGKGGNIKSNGTLLDAISISGIKKCTRITEGPSLRVDSTAADFDGPPEPKPARRGTRKSLRIKKRQTTATVGTRAGAMRGKTGQVNGQTASDAECKELITISPRFPVVESNHDVPLVFGPQTVPTPCRKIPSPKADCNLLIGERKNGGSVPPALPQDVLKAESVLCGPDVTPTKEQRKVLGAQQPVKELHVKNDQTTNDEIPLTDPCTVENVISPVQKVTAYALSLKVEEDVLKPSRPIVESIPPAETVAIDLTVDNVPPREKSELHNASTVLKCPEPGQTDPRVSDQSDCTATEEPVLISPPPRQKRRSVNFASPIEYIAEKKFNCQSPSLSESESESESDILSPLRILGPVSLGRESPDRTTPQVEWKKSKILQASVFDHAADKVEIQDIVEVLNEIQAVIIKGISNRFRNVQRDVQHGRDELIRQVLDELQSMVIENARYFNGLVRLEEDYYKNGKALTHCWEELIECNDRIAAQFRNALTEYDQNISAKTFPKSLLPMKPASLVRTLDGQRSK